MSEPPVEQPDRTENLPEDPDVERADVVAPLELDVLGVIALGGALGSLGRWGLGELLPHAAGEVGWSTFLVNATGAFALGLLMALIAGPWSGTRLVRPFLGVGLLGGWTTFSAYALDTRDLLAADRVTTGLVGYLVLTLAVGLLAMVLGLGAGRALAGRTAVAPAAGGSA